MYRAYSIECTPDAWTPENAAKQTGRKSRLIELSTPRSTHPDYVPPRPAMPVISKAAQEAIMSPRVEELSKPFKRYIVAENDWQVKVSALNYKASDKILQLSRPRPYANGYKAGKTPDETWRVSPSALKATISHRILELSKPHIRSVATNLPRTDAFIVSEAAKRARASERIIELAQPVARST